MKKKAPAFQWYPKDILTSERVSVMTLEVEGAYRRAIDYCWLNGSVPSDSKTLANLIGKGCKASMAEVIKKMFIQDPNNPDRMLHERLEQERLKQKEWINKSAAGGKKSAEKRKGGSTTLQPPLPPKDQNGGNQSPTLHSSSAFPLNTNTEEALLLFEKVTSDQQLELGAKACNTTVEAFSAYARSKAGKLLAAGAGKYPAHTIAKILVEDFDKVRKEYELKTKPKSEDDKW